MIDGCQQTIVTVIGAVAFVYLLFFFAVFFFVFFFFLLIVQRNAKKNKKQKEHNFLKQKKGRSRLLRSHFWEQMHVNFGFKFHTYKIIFIFVQTLLTRHCANSHKKQPKIKKTKRSKCVTY